MSKNPKWPPPIDLEKTDIDKITNYTIFSTFLGARNPKKDVILVI